MPLVSGDSTVESAEIDECSAKEVAEKLGTSTGSVYVFKSRVIKRIVETIRSVDGDAWEMEMIQSVISPI